MTYPVAAISRAIENLVLYGNESTPLLKGACLITARLISTTVFPIFLTLELIFLRIPKVIFAIGTEKFQQKQSKAFKYFAHIIPSILLGPLYPNAEPSCFLKRPKNDDKILPFGVENILGKTIPGNISYPKTIEEVQKIVRNAKECGQQLSVIGSGMSQGMQTIPNQEEGIAINPKYLNSIQVDTEGNTVTVGAGATWEQVQLTLDEVRKSVIVKQASDIFSIGGSIAINCHGWAHTYGAIASTVRSLKMIDSEGRLRTLTRPPKHLPLDALTDDQQLFKCLFGTLGYFGIVVEVTFDIVDNVMVQEEVEEILLDEFIEKYRTVQSDLDVDLFGGRLILDSLNGDPLRKIWMVKYRKQSNEPLKKTIKKEPKLGTFLERTLLKLIAYLPNFFTKIVIQYYSQIEKQSLFSKKKMSRNEALHPPINAFKLMHQSDYYAYWLQEYFIKPNQLPNFIRFLGAELKANDVKLINATIRPVPKDPISILPYAEQDRFGVVICFSQKKTATEIKKTEEWINNIHAYLAHEESPFYQAYMPNATREQFKRCYGAERVKEMLALKKKFDATNTFGNGHTAKYYDPLEEGNE